MKKLLITLALVSSVAAAEDWWESPTTAGGRIVLTTQSANWCPKGFWIAYIEMSNQDALYGCWVSSNDRIHAKFNNGTTKIYDKDGWTYKTDGKK